MDAADVWVPFRGDNAIEIEASRHPPAGPARLARHFGKPLSDELWEDVLRLRVRTLRVCTPDDRDSVSMSFRGHLWHQMILFLDGDGNLQDVLLHGRCPARKAGVSFEDA